MPFWDGSFGIAESPYCMESVPWWLDLSSQLDEQNTHRIASCNQRENHRAVLLGKVRRAQPLAGSAPEVLPSVRGVSASAKIVLRTFLSAEHRDQATV